MRPLNFTLNGHSRENGNLMFSMSSGFPLSWELQKRHFQRSLNVYSFNLFSIACQDFFVPASKYPKGLNRILGIFLPNFISLCLCLYPACIWVIDIPVAKGVKEIAFFVNSHAVNIRPIHCNRRILCWNNHLFLCQLP